MSSNRPGTGLIVEKNDLRLTISHLSQACFLKGKPIVDSIERWCLGHNRSGDGITPTLAVLYFDTGSDARDYLKLKAEVAAKVQPRTIIPMHSIANRVVGRNRLYLAQAPAKRIDRRGPRQN